MDDPNGRQFYVSGEVGFLHFFFMLVIGQPKIIVQRCGHIRRCAILPVVAISGQVSVVAPIFIPSSCSGGPAR